MSFADVSANRFLTAAPARLFLSTAVPTMVLMMMSGLLSVVDAAFLGHFVGAGALAAVSLVFPVMMITVALSTLVSGGMSSLLARHLGAGARDAAASVFAGAHGLALCLSAGLIALFLAAGAPLLALLARDQAEIAAMAWRYLAILILFLPVQLLLGLHADLWRNEGRAAQMALTSVGVTLANVAFNYLLIVRLDMGVAGSAWGTVAAQALGLALLAGLRLRGTDTLPLGTLSRRGWGTGWHAILVLGAPVSFGFLGIAVVSTTVIAALRLTAGPGYADMVAAYGIVTRIFSFTFLPLMAIGIAMQTIVGNNAGAARHDRAEAVLRLAAGTAFALCLAVEAVLLADADRIGRAFVTDPQVVALVGTILRPMAALYLFTGPVLVLALYFQAVGRPARTAALTLLKPFLLAPALIAGLAALFGARSIWFAFPLADAFVAAIALAIALASRQGRPGSGMLGGRAR